MAKAAPRGLRLSSLRSENSAIAAAFSSQQSQSIGFFPVLKILLAKNFCARGGTRLQINFLTEIFRRPLLAGFAFPRSARKTQPSLRPSRPNKSQSIGFFPVLKILLAKNFCARGGTRTHKPLLAQDFKSCVYTIPPPGQNVIFCEIYLLFFGGQGGN